MRHHSTVHYLAARRLFKDVEVLHAPSRVLMTLGKARAAALKAFELDPDSWSRKELLSQIDGELRGRIAALAYALDQGHRDTLSTTTDAREHFQIAGNAIREFDGILEALAAGHNPPEVMRPLQRLRADWADQQAVSQQADQDLPEMLTRADVVRGRTRDEQ